MIPVRVIIRQIERFIAVRILHANDTAQQLALGIALGMFIAWTPTVGVQMILVLLLAPLIRANGRIGLPIVWISNPFTIVPIYGLNHWLGYYLLSIFGERPKVHLETIKSSLGNLHNLEFNVFTWEFWNNLGQLFLRFLNVSIDLWVGSIIIGIFLAALSYIVSYKFINWYRTHKGYWQRRRRKEVRKLES